VTRPPTKRAWLAFVLVALLISGSVVAWQSADRIRRTHVTAYFLNSNGLYVGDDVRILGVRVGEVERIEPQFNRTKVTFWFDDTYKAPADANAVILAPSLVTARVIQLTPAYSGGPTMANGATVDQDRTAVPVEFDDVKAQLLKLSELLQPTEPGGVSTLGSFINTAADNLRGQGTDLRETMIQLSQAFSALGDHSSDIYSTIKNLAALVSGLQGSSDLLRRLNQNLAGVTRLLANDPHEVSDAVGSVNGALADVQSFVATNRESLGTASEKLASLTTAVSQSLDDIKQTLHVAPTQIQNYVNIYDPAGGGVTGIIAINNLANPIDLICGAIEAASRLGAEQSAKLCVQYLAPIVKNRQYNFLPLGLNPFVGAQARPNELTYSEDRLRPDYIPPQPPAPAQFDASAQPAAPPGSDGQPLPAEAPAPTGDAPPAATPIDPTHGLQGMMTPPSEGSQP
jgi:phospholipid/cholesterol/gamma-HCH transport system substrate-binding protein